jgi:1,4-dihydroxy-6-naphthoate synthase
VTDVPAIRCSVSPDADDLFMFRALMLGLIDTDGLRFDIRTADTERLNRDAAGRDPATLPHVSAISVAWYPSLAADWQLLPHGGSVGRGYGPVLVAPRPCALDELRGRRIAVPGLSTTAYTVLSLILDGDFTPVVVPIVPPEASFAAVADGHVDAVLLIHEGRLTFTQHGLHQVCDIGAWWQDETGLPLPLGGNVIRRDLGAEVISRASAVLRASIAHALDDRAAAISWLLERGGPLQTVEAVDHYLQLYANADTLDYGPDGRAGVEELLRRGAAAGLLPALPRGVDWAP